MLINQKYYRYSGEFHDVGVKLDTFAENIWEYVSFFLINLLKL